MSFILPGALRRREPLRSGGDVPTCTVSEGSRDGAAFLNPEGEKDAPADRYWGIQSVSAHAPAATPTTAGLLAISKLYYTTSTLPMGSLRAWGGECLWALFPSSVAHDISHFHAVWRGVEAVHALPRLPCSTILQFFSISLYLYLLTP